MDSAQPENAAPLPDRLAIFADFDGTLVDIAERPDAVSPPPDLAAELTALAEAVRGAFAIVTGRRIADIDHYLSPRTLAVAGSHGAERRRADGTLEEADEASRETAAAIGRALAPLVLEHPGLILEAKPASVALHYRQAPDLAGLCRTAMTKLVAGHPDFMVIEGKMVFEARPRRYSKGEAVRAFMREPPFAGRLPLFIGDDATDEDGFIAAQALGGVGVKLGDGSTAAKLRIGDVAAVHRLFGDIARNGDAPDGEAGR